MPIESKNYFKVNYLIDTYYTYLNSKTTYLGLQGDIIVIQLMAFSILFDENVSIYLRLFDDNTFELTDGGDTFYYLRRLNFDNDYLEYNEWFETTLKTNGVECKSQILTVKGKIVDFIEKFHSLFKVITECQYFLKMSSITGEYNNK
jgi:hypothetical protein